jgi:hypothetical protein
MCAWVVEYSCLHRRMAEWRACQPRRSQRRETRTWIAEGQDLFQQWDSLAATARHNGWRW